MKKRRNVENELPTGYNEKFKRKPKAMSSTLLAAKPKVKAAIKAINNKPEYKDADLKADKSLREKYNKEVSKAITDQLNAASTLKSTTFSGYKLHFDYDVNRSLYPSVHVKRDKNPGSREEAKAIRKIKHADEGGKLDVYLKTNDTYHVVDFSFGDVGEIQHYGVPGMKWGVRKKDRSVPGPASGSNATKTGVAQNPKGAEEALRPTKILDKRSNIRVANSGVAAKGVVETRVNKDGTVSRTTNYKDGDREINLKVYKDIRPRKGGVIDTMTNDELRKTIERMKLEKEYGELAQLDLSKGKKLRKKIATKAVDTLVDKGVSLAVSAALGVAAAQITKKTGVKVQVPTTDKKKK